MKTRMEHDLLGEREVPANAYYGVHTLRALENFSISGIPISTYPNMIKALACVKQACAQANHELDLLRYRTHRCNCKSLRRDTRRKISRTICCGCDPGRRGNFDQHECE